MDCKLLSCFSQSNTTSAPSSPRPDNDSGSRVPPQPNPPESSSAPSLKSIKDIIEKEGTNENIDKLFNMLDDLLLRLKGTDQEVSTSSSVEDLASTTSSASKFVDFVSKEAESISNMESISQELGNVGVRVLDAIAGSHYIFLGLSLVSYALQTYLKMNSNDSACKEVLEELIELAKQVKDFKDAVPGEVGKVHNALLQIVVAVVTCCEYIDKTSLSRYWEATVMESHLQKTKEIIKDRRSSLTFTAATYNANRLNSIKRQTAAHSMPSPSEHPADLSECMDERVEDVKRLLAIEGSEDALAVVLVGPGGIGKSTLAASVIHSMNLPATNFKLSRVTIDQKTPDKRSHIVQLQSDIIYHFTGNVQHVQDPEQGREKLQEAMAGKCCLLYIDNVVDSYNVKELLPRELFSQKRSIEVPQKQMQKTKSRILKPSEKVESEKSEENDPQKQQMQTTKIRILITSRQELKSVLNINMFEHNVRQLSPDTTKELLSRIILQGCKPAQDFEEEPKINELAKACGGVPLLLSIFGNHLKDNREKSSYDEAIKALKEGNIDRYGPGDEELVSERLMFVYDQMKDEEAQEAFIDICTYFNGRPWDLVADIMDSATLAILHKKNLVSKSESGSVIVHDILRLMGERKAKDTRLMNYEEFFHINDDDSKLKNVKGMVLLDRTFLATLETRHLNAMRDSLRFLVLGDWVRVDGPPCVRAFKKLRYLQVGDLKDFPFKDLSKMEKLNVFLNGSKSGLELARLPPSLKHLSHQIPYQDCNEIARFPLKNLESLKAFTVETKTSVKLPQGFNLPASLEDLRLISCEQMPETFGHLPALQNLALDKCDLKCFPPAFTQCTELRTLSMQNCTNLISLKDRNFASLCSLRDLDLNGCTRLEELPADLGTLTALKNLNIGECENLRVLPDSLGMLNIEHLTLESLASLKELPQTMGNLSRLKDLSLKSCDSLEFVPDSLVQLTNLDTLVVEDCINLRALPQNFDQLCSLKKITLTNCNLLTKMPDGFEALKTLQYMKLADCNTFPACFEMLSCLEELRLYGLPFSSLPDGLGKLKRLKILDIDSCHKFHTLPLDFENLTASKLYLNQCRMLEGTTMDRIVNLQNCWYVNMTGSFKLIERCNELKEENKSLQMILRTSWNQTKYLKELNRAERACLLWGKCIELDSTTNELTHHSSLSIPNNTTLALISLHLDQTLLFQQTLDMAKDRAASNCAGQLRIIYVCTRNNDSDAPNEEDETENIRQALRMLPQGISFAIPSTDVRRLSLIGYTLFDNENVFNDSTGPKFLCFMADVREDDEGNQVLTNFNRVTEDKISKKSVEKRPLSKNCDEEVEISGEIVDFINCSSESKTQSSSEQSSRLSEENMAGQFIQKLKNNGINHFIRNKVKNKDIHHFRDKKVKVDYLKGKTVAIILIEHNYPECIRLQQIYCNFKLKYPSFEAIWIPLQNEKDLGLGTYSRAIQCMPWLTLADPKLIRIDDIKDKSPRIIIINRGGSIENRNALSHVMSWGADVCPFTKGSLSQLDLKSSLEILFHSTEIDELNKKVNFLYAEPPSQELKMKCSLEKLVEIHGKGNFEIVYVGTFFTERNGAESLRKAYEDATQSMNWTKLSYGDMMTLWYRCKYLAEQVVQEPNSASTLNRVVKALFEEKRWLVVVDGDGMVTASGIDVVEVACETSDEKDDEVDMMMNEELRESLKEGKCSELVRRYFRDELEHTEHEHALRTRKDDKVCKSFSCNRCYSSCVYTLYGKRSYRCEDCDWDLCWDCWKEFAKEVRKQATKES